MPWSEWSSVVDFTTKEFSPPSTEVGIIVPLGSGTSDQVGSSCAVSGDDNWLVIAARLNDTVANNSGAAYIYKKVDGSWVLKQKLAPSSLNENSQFGYSASISRNGKVIAIGAAGSTSVGTGAGAIYVFTREDNSDNYLQTGWLWSDQTVAGDVLGTFVNVSGDGKYIFGGCPNGTPSKYGYVAIWEDQTGNGQTWTLQTTLFAPDKLPSDNFGSGLASNADASTLVVGANHVDGAGTDRGASYIFKRDGETWNFLQKITPPDIRDGDLFGERAVITRSGDRIVYGVYYKFENTGNGEGAVYVYALVNGVYVQEAKIVPTEPGHNYFGWSVAIDKNADNLYIAARTSSYIHIFQRNGSVYNFYKKVRPSASLLNLWFGYSTTVSENNEDLISSAVNYRMNGLVYGGVFLFE